MMAAAQRRRRCLERLWRGIDCGSRGGVVPNDDTEDAESLIVKDLRQDFVGILHIPEKRGCMLSIVNTV